MITDTEAVLAFGDALGLLDFDWPGSPPAWTLHPKGRGEGARCALLYASGFTETYGTRPGYLLHEGAAWQRIGLDLVAYGQQHEPRWILAVKTITAPGGSFERVDLTVPDDARQRLDWGLSALGIERGTTEFIPAREPAWLLTTWSTIFGH